MIHLNIKETILHHSTVISDPNWLSESSNSMIFIMMLFWLVLLGQGTFNALIMLAIKHYYLQEDVNGWKSSVYVNFLICTLVYFATATCYFSCINASHGFVYRHAFLLSFILYLMGQTYCIYYCVQRARKLED